MANIPDSLPNNSNLGSNANAPVSYISEDGGGITFIDIIENVLFFRWYFLAIFAITSSLGVLYALMANPVYISDALIQVEERKGSSLGALSQVAKVLDVQQSPVLGEIEILRSRTVIGSAVEAQKANITISVDNRLPLFGGWLSRILDRDTDGLAKPLWQSNRFAWGGEELRILKMVVPPKIYGENLYLKIGPDRTWTLYDDEDHELLKGQGTEQVVESQGGKFILGFETIKARSGTVFKLKVFSLLSRIEQISKRMTASETKRQSGIIRVTFEAGIAQQAAQMLNAITSAYVDQNVSRRSEEAEKSLEFLNKELPRLKADLEISEQNLNSFRNEKRSLDVPGEIRELLVQSTNIERTRAELELKRKEYLTRYQPDYPLLKGIDSQLREVKAQNEQLNKSIAALPQVQQDYIRKARDVEVNNQLYVSLLNNAQQLQIAKAGTVGNVAVVDPAVAPEKPARPNKPLTVSIASLAGLVLGFVFCQLLALITGVVRDPKKLEMSTGLTSLGVIPLSSEQLEAVENEALHEDAPPFLLAEAQPASPVIEGLRTLRTSLLFALASKVGNKVILITSAVPSQGKSFISANLGYLMAATNKKVILVEADVRRASIRRYIDFEINSPGLTNVLNQEITLEAAIKREVHPNFDFLCAGARVKNPGDMLSTDALKNLIFQLRKEYDYVIVDSPPLLAVNDARSLAKLCDITLFAVRQEMVRTSEVREAIDIFNKTGMRIDGLIFNGFVPSRIRYGYNYGYGYGGYYNLGKYLGRYKYYTSYSDKNQN